MNPLEELFCPRCGAGRLVGLSEKLTLLRRRGKLRRAAKPEPEVIAALLECELLECPCDACGARGLALRERDASAMPEEEDPEFWGQLRRCADCGEAIHPERLEIFPDARRCARCQEAQRAAPAEPEFCPRCAEPLQMRTTSGAGLTRYRLRCDRCGYSS